MKTKTQFTNRILSLVLALVMMLSMLPMASFTAAAAATTPAAYDGVPVTPAKITSSNYKQFGLTDSNWSSYNGYYGIRNAKELYGFANLVNGGSNGANAVLLQDITVNTGTVTSSGATYSWTPIGSNSRPYLGTFDGNGHTVSGIYINGSETCVGLFGVVGRPYERNGAVRNLQLSNSYICGSSAVGGIAGELSGNYASISYCTVGSDVTVVATTSKFAYIGGICGDFGINVFGNSSTATVSNCAVLGKVSAPNADANIGAVIGYYRTDSNAYEFILVSNCFYVAGNTLRKGQVFDVGKGGGITATDAGCTMLNSVDDAHTCVSVTHTEVKPTCKYPGRSAYSYCLFCGKVTSGTKTDYAVVDHGYSAPTCKTPATCIFCGITTGDVNAGNHAGTITTYKRYNDAYHYGIYSCCGAYTEYLEHSYSTATCVAVQKCSICGATIGEVDAHNHASSEKIYAVNVSDRTMHDYKYKCCGLIIETKDHSFDSNSYCSTCGYTCEHLKTQNGVCAACGKTGIGYINRYWDSANKAVVSNNAIASSVTLITSATTSMSSGWYILESDVTITDRISTSGTVNIILTDGFTLTASAGICVNSGATLNIYGQAKETGKLVATVSPDVNYGNDSGIGGNSDAGCGTINIHGGTVTATARRGAAIGSGWYGSGGAVVINGGTVNATNTGAGPAIGGGSQAKNAGTVTINAGTVTAANTDYSLSTHGAGIGGGYKGTASNVIINGGNVKASSLSGKAIGAGSMGSGGSLKNADGTGLSLQSITLDGAMAETPVTVVEGIKYDITSVKTLDTNKLYFYLPSGVAATSFTAGGTEYICKDNTNTYYSNHDWSNADGTCIRCNESCEHSNITDATCNTCGKVFHAHQWEYTTSGTTITATCKADGCPNDDGGSITLNVTDAYYTRDEVGATVTGDFTNGATYKLTYNNGSETAPNSIGTHTAKLTVYENGTEKHSMTAQYTISYLEAPNPAYAISDAYEDNGTYWFKTGAVAKVSPPYGFMISTNLGDAYTSFVYFDEGDSKIVYLKRVSDGALTDAVNVEGIRFDGNGATGKITIENRGFWEKLVNKITFGLFFKGNAVANISATDHESGCKSIQYYIANEDLIKENDTSALEAAIGSKWNDYSNEIALSKNAKNVIYVKITDNVGNVSYLSSEGIVLYSDAEAVTENVSATYKAGADKTVTVELNGNTVKSVANGTEILSAGTDYTVSANGMITLKASYLDTLNAGTYPLTVSYNPLGETYVETPENDAPATTAFNVVIAKADGKVSNINISGKTYDGTAVAAPTFDKLGDGAATIEYKVKGADDSTYTTVAPSNAGDYVVRVTVGEGRNHKEASSTAEFTIDRATLKDVSVQQNGKLTYHGGTALTPTVTANATALNGAKVLFMYSTDGRTYGSMPSFTQAGTYTVHYCAYTTDNNFLDQYDTFTVTVDMAVVNEPTIASKPYNASAQTADIADTELYTVEENNGGTAKGSYDVVLKLKDSANYKWSTTDNAEVTLQFAITAVQNAWDTTPAISGWTYGETAKTPVGAAKYGTVKVVYSGKVNDGSDYNSETVPTKAGNYTATFTVEGTGDYSSLSEQVTFTIAKKAVTVTANDASKIYGDSDPALTYTNTALVGQDTLDITVSRASGENANTYTITASQENGANPNYEITFKTGTFTISKAALTITAEDKAATYGDAVPTYTVKYDGFVSGDDKDDLGGTLNFYCDYRQYDDVGEYEIKPHGLTSDNYVISYNFGKLTVSPKAITVTIQNATSVYSDTLAELKATDNGIVNGDANVYSLATTATSASNVGKYAITGTALDGNYAITFINGEYEITKREITITAEAKNTIVNTALPTYTYKVEGLVGEDMLVTEPTLTSNADIAVVGEYDITAAGADAGGNYSIKYVPAKLTVLTDNAVDAAAGYTEELKDYDPKTVTSADKAELDDILEEVNTILGDASITDNGKKALEAVKEQVEALIKEINDAAEAIDTENTEKVDNVTPENVTPENKTDLENAKADLEKALEDNGGNYTEDEKKAIQDEIKRIEDALEIIGNVEAVEETVSKLPAVDTVEPDDAEAIKAVTDAQTAYNALSDYEKSLVDEATKANLDKLAAALVAYDIVEGDGSSWTEDSNHNITFVVNGLFSKFVGIKVDGKDVDKANYEAKAGSTIITLKASYLDTLKVGKHTVTVVYNDGSADGTFTITAKPSSPATGDNSNLWLWVVLLFVSGSAVTTLTVFDRKRRIAK